MLRVSRRGVYIVKRRAGFRATGLSGVRAVSQVSGAADGAPRSLKATKP